jgi:hypothetical protein
MGILSDLVVADRAEAAAIGASVGRESWPSLESKGFTVLEVGLLHFVLTGQDPDAPANPPTSVKSRFDGKEHPVTLGSKYTADFECLYDHRESWVHEVPASLVDELAKATRLKEVASKWAEFEELEGGDPEDLAGVLAELQRLARLARAQEKSLLLWTSL